MIDAREDRRPAGHAGRLTVGAPLGQAGRRRRSAARPAGLVALLQGAALLGAAQGCAGWPKVITSTRNEDRPVRSYEVVEVSPQVFVLPSMNVERDAGGQPGRVRIEAARERECTHVAHRVVDRTTVYERDVESPLTWYFGYIAGSVGVTMVTTGSVLIATDNASQDGPVLPMTVVGHLLMTNMVGVVGAQIRAIDSSEHVGVVDEESRRSERCRREPLGGVPVRLVAQNGESLLEGATDAGGRFEAPIDVARALELGTSYTVWIDGAVAGRLHIEASGAFQKAPAPGP